MAQTQKMYLGTHEIGKQYLGDDLIIQRGAFVGWTPANFTDVQYWWTADSGVTTDTGGVSSWLDKINSFEFEQPTSGNRPSYGTSSNLNGQNVITFNGTSDYLYVDAQPATIDPPAPATSKDVTMLCVFYLASTTPGEGVVFGYPIIGAESGRAWLDGRNDDLRTLSSFFTTNDEIASSSLSTGPHAWKFRLDNSAADTFYALDELTETQLESNSGGTDRDWNANGLFTMGALLNSRSNKTVFDSRYIAMELAEAVVVYNSPSADEMNEWKEYVNQKYGSTIIS